MPREYRTATAFRTALEDRLTKIAAAENVQVNRLRRQVAFDRLLARLFRTDPAPWVLKGGYALELRFKTSRATIDIDLTVQRVAATTEEEANQIVREMVQSAAGLPLDDWFEYIIGAPAMDLDAAPYGGARYPIEARMDGRVFARFHLDAGRGDAVMQPVDTVECRDWLAFAGIASPTVPTISREQQFAEKLHAYTLPRSSTNSRVKDLIDMALLIRSGQLAPEGTAHALRLTFDRRQTHALPPVLLEPPSEWQGRFNSLAEECHLPANMATLFAEIEAFLTQLAETNNLKSRLAK
jgi:hypothetical protein